MNAKDYKKKQMSEATLVMAVLTVSGGLQDAYSYFVRGQVFANGQTGNIVLMSAKLYDGDFAGAFRYLIPITAFTAGVFVAEQIHSRYKHASLLHWRQLIVAIEAVMLLFISFLPVSQEYNMAANAVTSFVCAMQVQTFRKVNGCSYASTMCIGNIRSGMELLGAYVRTKESRLLRQAGQYFFVILMFSLGAGLGAKLSEPFGGRMILISCVLLGTAFALMHIKRES